MTSQACHGPGFGASHRRCTSLGAFVRGCVHGPPQRGGRTCPPDRLESRVAVGAQTVADAARLVGGRYELEALIGKGGVGEVWRARHLALNSRVAIKFLQLASADKESAQRRFTTEAQVTAQLKTAHAVQVFDFGVTEDGRPYLVMELLEGETLGRRLERVGRLTVAETVRLLGQAARALHRAHALGIVHRDFKPDNIVISPDDEGREQVKVLDFGVAKLLGALEEGADADEAGGPERSPAEPSFTRTGAVLGTPLYMAPEQVRNPSQVDLKADIWAFGVVAFECLTGRSPFHGNTLAELFERIQASQHPSAVFLEPSVPAAFDIWFDLACSPDPRKRFINASVAWKQLTVALDADGHERSGSFPGLDVHEQSGQRRVVVVPGEERADASAPTLEGEPKELLSRTHDDGFHSLRRIPRAALTSGSVRPPAPAPEVEAVAAPAARAAHGTRRAWIPAAVLGVGALASIVVWRAVAAPPGRAATGVIAPTTLAPPPPTSALSAEVPRAPAVLTSTVASAPPTASSSGAPATSPSASHGGARAARAGTHPPTTDLPSSPPTPEPVVAAPATASPIQRNAGTPPPAASGLDPGSYR